MATRSPAEASRVDSRPAPALPSRPSTWRHCFTHVDAVVLTFDAVGVVTFVTPSVRELLGYEPCGVGRSRARSISCIPTTPSTWSPTWVAGWDATVRRESSERARPHILGWVV